MKVLFLAGLLSGLPLLNAGAQAPVYPVRYSQHAVVSESRLASEAGLQMLRAGGNAVDAAVATAFTLAVTHPAAGNIGGGGFLVVWTPNGEATTFDFREKAPRAAHERMYLDAGGSYDRKKHHWSIYAVGVPGSVAGLHRAHLRFGQLPWKRLLAPAIHLARDGFALPAATAESMRDVLPSMREYPASMAKFSKQGVPYTTGDRFVQPELASTLRRIAANGRSEFYRGQTARQLTGEMKRQGGLITLEDLRLYRAVERRPVVGSYRDYTVLGMPPPSSGGVAVIEMLNILEGYPLAELGPGSAAGSHYVTEAMRRAFADRARHVGDPDFVKVPVERLTSKAYAEHLRGTITPGKASPSAAGRFDWPAESSETTHLSVADRDGMAVSLTTTLEQSYGSRIVVPGAGFLLNNEMGDFNPQPGRTDDTGMVGTAANLVAPQKRMISSMSPTIVTRDGKLVLVLGTPGGRTIINSVLQVILNILDHDMRVQPAVDAPRFHHQWLPDEVVAERWCFSPDTQRLLEGMGHTVRWRNGAQGSVMAILACDRAGSPRDYPAAAPDRCLEVGVDRRRGTAAAVGE